MAKKVKFGLEMADGEKVRTIEDLREHFDLKQVIDHFQSGKLLEWLEDRYYESIAKTIRTIDSDAPDFKQKLCDALGVDYEDEDISLEDMEIEREKKAKLKQLTSDEIILSHAADVALSQEELADLLDADRTTIYLCGKDFHIPAKENMHYIGILGEPFVHVNAESREELEQHQIILEHVRLPEHLELPKEPEKPISTSRKERRPYHVSSLFDSRLSDSDRKEAEKLYNVAQDILGNIDFDVDAGSRPLERVVQESNLKGAFAKYLERIS